MGKTRLAGAVLAVATAIAIWAVPAPLLAQARSSIGLRIHDLTAEEASKAKVAGSGGVAIDQVIEGTPAARAGLRGGDIVIEYDGERVRSAQHLTRLVQETAAGRPVSMTIVRDGRQQTVQVTAEQGRAWLGLPDLRLQDDFPGFPGDRLFEMPLPRVRPDGRRLGTSLLPLNDQLAAYFGVKEGVLVSSVDPSSPAATAGLKAGDVIIAVNGRMVRDPSEVRRAMMRAPGGSAALDLQVMRERKETTIRIPAGN